MNGLWVDRNAGGALELPREDMLYEFSIGYKRLSSVHG